MLDINVIPQSILEAIAKNLGWRAFDYRKDYDPAKDPIEPYLEQIKKLDAEEALDRYMIWHGLGDWADNIIYALDTLREAQTD